MAGSRVERVVKQPGAQRKLAVGVNQIVEAIRPSLGPLPRLVAVERAPNNKAPELLDDGAVIARRIIGLLDRDADMGAMFLRQVLWSLHETAGDGTATAAIIFHSVYNQAQRYIASGGNAMRLRPELEQAARNLVTELARMAVPVRDQAQLGRVAEGVCDDAQLAKHLGEIFERIGPYGALEVRSSPTRELRRQYVDGVHWLGGVFSRNVLDKGTQRVDLDGAAILISDLAFESPPELVPVLEMAAGAGIHRLVVVASKMSDGVLGLMLANQDPDRLQVVGVKAPEATPMGQAAALEDMAILTGGRPIIQAAGRNLASVRLDDLGRAGRAWADHYYFGIAGGQGAEAAVAGHLVGLQARHARAARADERRKLQQRIGTLRGRKAIVWAGGGTKAESEARKQTIERAAETLRAAMREGVVAGGGAALLACRDKLLSRRKTGAGDSARVAQRIVAAALEQPLRQIAANAGYNPGEVMAELCAAGPNTGFDARTGRAINMLEAGVIDSAAVVKAAAYTAIVSAALLLTVDVLVHHRKPDMTMQP